MAAPEVQGIDLFKIANRSISGWIPSLKTGTVIRQPFCSQLEERLLLWLEYHPLVVNYARGDIDPQFATKYRLPIPQHAPFAIGYTFENKPHHYLPDVVGTLTDGKPFIAEAGMEDDKRGDRNLAKAEAARRLARFQQGIFWIGTERTLTKRHHYNLVFLHARRKAFPAFADIAEALASVWPWGEMTPVSEVASRLEHQFPIDLVEAAIWKVVAEAAAQGLLLVDLEQFTLSRTLPLALLPPDAPVLVPSPQPAGRRTGTGRGHPKQRLSKGGHPPFDAFAARSRDPRKRSDCLSASWQLPKGLAASSGLCRVYPSAVWTFHTAVHDRDSRAYRNATGGGTFIEGNRNHRQTSLLQAGAHSRAALEDGPGTGGDA